MYTLSVLCVGISVGVDPSAVGLGVCMIYVGCVGAGVGAFVGAFVGKLVGIVGTFVCTVGASVCGIYVGGVGESVGTFVDTLIGTLDCANTKLPIVIINNIITVNVIVAATG
jgi:hypothetical protein